MSECEFKSRCTLRGLLKVEMIGICEDSEPLLPTGPGPDSSLYAEYCPAWRCYESEKKRELVIHGPIVDKYVYGWVD